jgi:hypothetical protein
VAGLIELESPFILIPLSGLISKSSSKLSLASIATFVSSTGVSLALFWANEVFPTLSERTF